MDIETYADKVPQYYSSDIPALLEKYLEDRRPKNILDCGCGDGSLLYALKKKGWLQDKNVFAVDLSSSRVNLVRGIDSGFVAEVGSAEEIAPVRDQSIDLLISTQVIEHVDDRKMIAAIDRVVRPGGHVYLSTVFKKWYGWYFYRNNGKWVLDPTHVREYQRDAELLELIDRDKFKVIENKKTLFWFPLVDALVKCLRVRERTIFENRLFSWIRRIKVPIIGYFNWEIVLIKNQLLS